MFIGARISSVSLSALLVAFSLSSGCATTAVPRLPTPLAGEDDAELLAAHQRMNRAYESCSDEYFGESLPFPLLLTGATGASAVALVAAAGALAFVLPDVYGAAGAAGAGAGALLFAGLTVFFGTDILPFYGRANVREAALQKARYDAQKALRTRDPDEVDRVTRRLYENCRVANVTANEDSASTMMRDLERYRREADSQRRWVKTLEGQRQLEQQELEQLRQQAALPRQPTVAPVVDPIARVNGVDLRRANFDAQVAAQKGTSLIDQKTRVLAARMLGALATQKAPKLGVSLSSADWAAIRTSGVARAGGPDAFAAEAAAAGMTEMAFLEPIASAALLARVVARLRAAGKDPAAVLVEGAKIVVFVEGVTAESVTAAASAAVAAPAATH